MKTLITLLFACCFGSAMAQSNLPACFGTDVTRWTACFGTESTAGDTYIGEFKDGTRHGKGRIHFFFSGFNGDKYVGEFKDDNFNGLGTYFFLADNQFKGDKYVGEWWNNRYHGQGIFTFANGDKYVGEFEYGNFHGEGIKYLANGKIEESGLWKDGVLVKSKFVDVAVFTNIPKLSNSPPITTSRLPPSTVAADLPPELKTDVNPTTPEPSELENLRAAAEQAKREKAELEACPTSACVRQIGVLN